MIQFDGIHVLCIGDAMLDRFLYGAVERISPEAPVPVVLLNETKLMLGGVGNVARNISSLGGTAIVVGLLGDDATAQEVRDLIAATPGIEDATVASAHRPTICKNRLIAGHQQVVRFDTERTSPANAAEAALLLAAIAAQIDRCQVVILSDYAKGVLAAAVINATMKMAAERGIPVFVDPKGEDFTRYRRAFCITPNVKELRDAAKMPVTTDAEVASAAQVIIARAGVHAVLVTRSEKGMLLATESGEIDTVPTEAQEVFDVSGAGDTAIATLALAHAAGHALPDAMRIANAAAGIVVGKLGTATVDAAELRRALAGSDERSQALMSDHQAITLVRDWQARGLRVGFTNGCFDILHAGHVGMLRAARARCDRLIVGLNSDASTARLKGPERPINPLADRAVVMAGLAAVDAVVSFEDDTPLAIITALRPDMLFKGADWTGNVVGADFVQSLGGEVVLLDLLAGRSTTNIIAQARKRHG